MTDDGDSALDEESGKTKIIESGVEPRAQVVEATVGRRLTELLRDPTEP